MMGLVCTKSALRTHTYFQCPMCTWWQHPVFGFVHANPVSLINARPRNERLIFFVCCTAQRSVCTSSALLSSPRVQDHGPERLSMFINAAGVIIISRTPKRTPRPAMLCRPRQLQFYLSVMCSWARMHSTRKAVRNWFTARGGPAPTEGGTDTHTGFASADHLD